MRRDEGALIHRMDLVPLQNRVVEADAIVGRRARILLRDETETDLPAVSGHAGRERAGRPLGARTETQVDDPVVIVQQAEVPVALRAGCGVGFATRERLSRIGVDDAGRADLRRAGARERSEIRRHGRNRVVETDAHTVAGVRHRALRQVAVAVGGAVLQRERSALAQAQDVRDERREPGLVAVDDAVRGERAVGVGERSEGPLRHDAERIDAVLVQVENRDLVDRREPDAVDVLAQQAVLLIAVDVAVQVDVAAGVIPGLHVQIETETLEFDGIREAAGVGHLVNLRHDRRLQDVVVELGEVRRGRVVRERIVLARVRVEQRRRDVAVAGVPDAAAAVLEPGEGQIGIGLRRLEPADAGVEIAGAARAAVGGREALLVRCRSAGADAAALVLPHGIR